MKLDLQKSREQWESAVNKAAETVVEVGKKAGEGVKENAQLLAQRVQDENQKALLKKYNPLFPEVYHAEGFSRPELIVIADDAERKDIAICRGAIGWLSKEKGIEVLHLYDAAVQESGLHFIPPAANKHIYYMNPHNHDQYILLNSYFETIQQVKLAELQHIAYSLGAKKYSVEMQEAIVEKKSAKQKAGASTKMAGIGLKNTSASMSLSSDSETHRGVLACTEFGENTTLEAPKLVWYADDDNVRNLVEMRLSGKANVKQYDFRLSNSSSMSMSVQKAAEIDASAGKLGTKGGFDLQSAAKKESQCVMIFHVEF